MCVLHVLGKWTSVRFRACLDPMQPPVRPLPPGKNDHTSRATPDTLDGLLEFDAENPNPRRKDETRLSTRSQENGRSPDGLGWSIMAPVRRPASVAPSSSHTAVVGRPQRNFETPAARSKERRSLRPLALGVFGSALLAVLVAQQMMTVLLPAHSENVSLTPPLPATPVQAAPPIAMPIDTAPVTSAAVATEKKPEVRASIAPLSRVMDVPVAEPAASRPVADARFSGSLAIDSTPGQARVFLNGEAVGVTPLLLTKLPVGSRAIRLEAEGHTSWSSSVRVVSDQDTRVHVTMSRLP